MIYGPKLAVNLNMAKQKKHHPTNQDQVKGVSFGEAINSIGIS